jgi:uncharacterized protein DUF4240
MRPGRPSSRTSALGLALIALVWLAGCGGDAAAPQAGSTDPAPASAPAAASAQPAPSAQPEESAQPAPSGTETPAGDDFDEQQFWTLVDDTRAEAGGDTERQSGLLAERLEQLPPRAVADFGEIRHQLDERAYTWDIWGAAFVIEDGCSDDCFRDFRGYLISLGRGPYEAALKNPDSLAGVAEDAETGDWENADNVAPEAYEDETGEDIPSGDSDLSGRPRGQEWDDDQQEQLLQRYPALAAQFR